MLALPLELKLFVGQGYLQLFVVFGRFPEAQVQQSAVGTERFDGRFIAVLTDAVHFLVKWGFEGERPDYLPSRIVGTLRVARNTVLIAENVLQVLFRDLVEIDQVSKSILLALDVDLGHCCEVLL